MQVLLSIYQHSNMSTIRCTIYISARTDSRLLPKTMLLYLKEPILSFQPFSQGGGGGDTLKIWKWRVYASQRMKTGGNQCRFFKKKGGHYRCGIQKEWAFWGSTSQNRGSFGVNCVLGQIWVKVCQLQVKIDKILILWWNYEKRGHCSLRVDYSEKRVIRWKKGVYWQPDEIYWDFVMFWNNPCFIKWLMGFLTSKNHGQSL